MKFIGTIVLFCVFTQGIFSQEVVGVHDVKPSDKTGEYIIKTKISGLNGADIARVKYLIDNTHTYTASPNNSLFCDRNESCIKFYVMAIPSSGELNVEFGLRPNEEGEYAFQVEFQYSKNEEKKVVLLPRIYLKHKQSLIAEETTVSDDKIEDVIAEVVEVPEPVVELPDSPVVDEERVAEVVVKKVPEIVKVPEVIEVPGSVAIEEVLEVIEKEEEVVAEVSEVVASPEPDVEEAPKPVEVSAPIVKSSVSNKVYTVQLLSLSEFSQSRLNTYCKKHDLSINDINKNKVGEWMKITYGQVSSLQEANQIKESLSEKHGITESFITVLK